MQVFGSKSAMSKDQLTPYYRTLLKSVDEKVIGIVDGIRKRFNSKLEQVENKFLKCEAAVTRCVIALNESKERELSMAENLVIKELRTKVLMSQWVNHFLVSNTAQELDNLDPITFSFSRFCLNMCLCYEEVPPSYFLSADVHHQMIAFLSMDSDLVIGPAMMALAHLSLLEPLRPAISASSGVFPKLLRIMVKSNSPVILTQACKLLGNLARHGPNKPLMASSGCFHAVLDLVLGSNKSFLDEHVQYEALCAVVNILSGSESNRVLLIELSGLKPLLNSIRMSSKSHIIFEAVKGVANAAFSNSYTASCILTEGGGTVLLDCLSITDITRDPSLVIVTLATLSNVCNSESTQTRIGSIPGLVETVIRICEQASDLFVVSEAANFLSALQWRNIGNKSRVSVNHGCEVLMKRLRALGLIVRPNVPVETVEAPHSCMVNLLYTASTMLLYEPAQEKLLEIKGLEYVVHLSKLHVSPSLLVALGQVICAVVPSPDDLKRYHDEAYIHPVEKLKVMDVLRKIKYVGFVDSKIFPEWIDKSINILSLSDEVLSTQKHWLKDEFLPKMHFSREFVTEIVPDARVLQDVDLRGMIFSIY